MYRVTSGKGQWKNFYLCGQGYHKTFARDVHNKFASFLQPPYSIKIHTKRDDLGSFFFIIIDSRRYLLTKFYQLKIRLAIVLNND